MELAGERGGVAIGVTAPLRRRIQRIERLGQAPARDLDRIRFAHAPLLAPVLRSPAVTTSAKNVRRQRFTKGTLRRIELQRQRLSQIRGSCLCMTRAVR